MIKLFEEFNKEEHIGKIFINGDEYLVIFSMGVDVVSKINI